MHFIHNWVCLGIVSEYVILRCPITMFLQKVQIQNTDFDQNDGYTGGAVSVEMSVNMTVSETSFYNNTGHQIGGALSIRVSMDALESCFVHEVFKSS